jgi:hypothetical protein
MNATKVEKIVYYTRFIKRTVMLVLLEHSSLSSSCPNQQSSVLENSYINILSCDHLNVPILKVGVEDSIVNVQLISKL